MPNTVVYVFDQTNNVKRLIRYCVKKNIDNVSLCPITTDQDAISLLVRSLSSIKNCDVKILPYLEYFNKIAFSERDNFIRFISEFGEKPSFDGPNLKEYFKYPHSSFSIWWLSLIFEKSPLKSNSYQNLVKLLSMLELMEEDKCKYILLDINSRELSCAIMHNNRGLYDCKDFNKHRMRPDVFCLLINFLKAVTHYFYLTYKIFIVTVNGGGLGFRKEILKDAKYMAISYFPLVDKKALKQERFVNKYYGLLQRVLENKYKDRFVWLAMAPGIDGFKFKDSVELGRQLNLWNYPIYFLEEWVRFKDLFGILADYFYFIVKFFIKIPFFAKNFLYPKEKLNIWSIFEQDWFSSFTGSTLINGLFYYRAFQNLSKKLKEKVVVTYLAENQAWERALNFALHDENKDLKSIGILHTRVPLLLLQLFDFVDDLQSDREIEFTMPKPDYLACNGRIPLRLFRAEGWDEKNSFLWFAVRYQHLKEHLKEVIPWENRQSRILVALSCSVKESKELLRYIHQAFSGQTGYQVIIKGHYTLSVRSLVASLNLDFNKNTFIFSDEELARLLPLTKAMVVAGSSAALESIAFGCPVIVPRLFSVVDMNPLSGISDLPIYVSNPKELQATVDEIIKRKDSPVVYQRCRDFIENYFEFYESENELIEKIERCLVTER